MGKRYSLVLSTIFSINIFIVSIYIALYDISLSVKLIEANIFVTLILYVQYFRFHYKQSINLHNIYLFTFFFFLLALPLFDMLHIHDISNTSFFTSSRFSIDTIYRTMICLYLALISYYIGALYSITTLPTSDVKWSHKSDKHIHNISLIIFKLSLPIVILYAIIISYEISKYGYISMHRNEINIPMVNLFRIASIAAKSSFALLLASGITNSKIFWLSTIAITFALVADGRRASGMTILIVAIWYYVNSNNINMRLRNLAIISSASILLAIIVGTLRYGQSNQINFSYFNFFLSQGGSVQVISYAIDWAKEIDYSFMDIFGNLFRTIDIIYSKIRGESPDVGLQSQAAKYKLYSSYISYIVNSKLYMRGFGIGGSYIAQLYSVGSYHAIILFSILLGYMMTKINYFMQNGNDILTRSLLILIIISIIFLPRDNVFDFVTDNLYNYLFLLIVIYVSRLLRSNN